MRCRQIMPETGGAVLLCSMLLAACLKRGLFFSEEMYALLAVWFILFALWLGGRAAAAPAEPADLRRPFSARWAQGRISFLMLCCPFIVMLLYVLQLLRSPVSLQDTWHELLRWGLYGSFAVLAYSCAGTFRGGRLLAVLWHLTGMLLSLSALLAVYGGLNLPYAVAYSSSSSVSATGARLAGLLEYPNTFGAVMAVFLLERLFAAAAVIAGSGVTAGPGAYAGAAGTEAEWVSEATAVQSRAGAGSGVTARPGTTYAGAAFAVRSLAALRLLPLFPYAAALLLSESRGAWLAAAAACAAALLRQPRLFAPLLAAGAAPLLAAALVYRQLALAMLAAEPWPGLAQLAGLWAGAWFAGLWLCRRRQRAAGRGRAAVTAAAAAGWAAAGGAALWQIRERISGPSPTALARGLLYRDAWRLAGEAPWLGRGGGSWRSQYLAAQSRPYVGSQVHSGYLDTLLNLGIVGLALTLLMLLAAGWLCAQAGPRLLAPLLVIALHAAVDFDWSYGLMWLLLLLLPALARADRMGSRGLAESAGTGSSLPPPSSLPLRERRRADPAVTQANLPQASCNISGIQPLSGSFDNPAAAAVRPRPALSPIKLHLQDASRAAVRRRLITVTVFSCCICLLLSLVCLRALQAAGDYSKAIGTDEPVRRLELLLSSRERNPFDPRPALSLSGMLPASAGIRLLQDALAASPENAALQWELAGRYMQEGYPGRGMMEVRRALALDRFNAAKWQAAIAAMLTRSEQNLAEKELERAAGGIAASRELMWQYRLLAEAEAGHGLRHNDRRFTAGAPAEALQLRLDKLTDALSAFIPAPRQQFLCLFR
ncbi:O-antigen ligase family protein ['Paenibacillus yunnanensis' Narsing Rao et al. 2020]|uniref:O-antigen ligase family protein n=1 Tax=Paenibacillus tengchongensis TaxID=2608684 RepID=UPI00124D375C|nr:O-antigen ligase family protein [Paenibacillus tengchongensis]